MSYASRHLPPSRSGTDVSGQTGASGAMLIPVSSVPQALPTPGALYQHVHDMASKRISTLDYLRKAHEGRVYWFNTLLFSKTDLSKLPYFEQRRLARRATNYLLLGFSLPAILDLNAQTPIDYLRAFNSLLAEFEVYQAAHPPDGSNPSSALARARIPQMFRRATAASSRKRTGSTAIADNSAIPTSSTAAVANPTPPSLPTTTGSSIGSADSAGLPLGYALNGETSSNGSLSSMGGAPPPPPGMLNGGLGGIGGGGTPLAGPSSSSALNNNSDYFGTSATTNTSSGLTSGSVASIGTSGDLLPGEEYAHLLTPHLPYDPDYFETFATLCDVLIDCYGKILTLAATPEACTAAVGELFAKADARVRKILVAGVVKEFEDASKGGVKSEVAGVGKVVLGGLM